MKISKYIEISDTKESVLWWSSISLFIVVALFLLYLVNENLYIYLSEEDNLFENLTALFYCIAGLILLWAAFKEYKDSKLFRSIILTLLLGLFFIVIAGEEISWGQRIFGIEASEIIKNINVQEEITIHNLKIFESDLGFDQHRILNIFCLLMGVLIPLAYLISKKIRTFLNLVFLPVAPAACIAIFLFGILYGQFVAKLYPLYSHTEVKEFIFSIGFLMFSVSHLTKKNKLLVNM